MDIIQTHTGKINKIGYKSFFFPADEVAKYYEMLVAEMQKQGAADQDFTLITPKVIMTAIVNNRKPEDVAWALLQ